MRATGTDAKQLKEQEAEEAIARAYESSYNPSHVTAYAMLGYKTLAQMKELRRLQQEEQDA